MKIFIVFTVLALLFIIGSALAMKAIGRNVPKQKRGSEQQKREKDERD